MTPRAPVVAVVGALALDEIQTPAGAARDQLGGSCAYVAIAASLLTPVEVISVIGDDVPGDLLDPLRERGVGLSSVRTAAGETFRWGCRYHDDWEQRDTLYTRTGVFSQVVIEPHASAQQATHLLLTAGQTDQNKRALSACRQRRLTMLDTIEREVVDERAILLGMLPHVDLLTLNEYEAGILSGEPRASATRQQALLAEAGAGKLLLKQGPRGADVLTDTLTQHVAAVAGCTLVDPTGAGDSFGGAALSALARGASLIDAVRWGCAVASFTIEGFGLQGLLRATRESVRERASALGLSATGWLESSARRETPV